MDVTALSTLELLRTHGAILDELRQRDVVRSAKSTISDLSPAAGRLKANRRSSRMFPIHATDGSY